ncbi:MAG: hypothetical protein Q8O53_02380 [Candidatus Moranbacteria bacterium]|nr:hypothetical protein [Candidatus Moranbacteria bacterium]
MELRNLVLIFQKQWVFFLATVVAFIFVAWIWQKEQAVTYQVTLLLNIGRSGVNETTNYTYDSFYRLQADERFADTVVRWLTTPRVVEDIYHEAGLNAKMLGFKDLSRVFTPGRLSSQMITVKYSGSNEKALTQLAAVTVTVLNRHTTTLNTGEKEKNWFVVIGSDPVIRDGRVGLNLALAVGLAVGLFIGFWLVLLRHYFADKK